MTVPTRGILSRWSDDVRAARTRVINTVPSDAIRVLLEMGYYFRVKDVEEWLDHENMKYIFRITHEVYELPPPTDFDPLQQRAPENIILTETREITLNDDLSTSSDTITRSQG